VSGVVARDQLGQRGGRANPAWAHRRLAPAAGDWLRPARSDLTRQRASRRRSDQRDRCRLGPELL